MRALLLFALSVLLSSAPAAQTETVTVETVLPAGSAIDDGLVIGPDGALYGARWGPSGASPGRTVTRVDLATGGATLFADGFTNTNGIDFDAEGNLYVANWGTATVEKIEPNGTRTTVATGASGNLSGLLVQPTTGVIYVTDPSGNNTVGIVDETAGTIMPFVVNDGTPPELNGPVGLAVDGEGRLYVSNYNDGKIFRVSDVGALTEVADLDGPTFFTTGYITYANGSLFATGIGTNVVHEVVLATGAVSVLAGSGTAGTVDGPAASAQFNQPNGIAATASGDTLYVSEFGSQAVRRIVRSRPTVTEAAPRATARLLPATPNPTSGEVSVRFELPTAQAVSVHLVDVLGREVAEVTVGERAAGLHVVPLDARALAPGTYLVRLKTADGVDTVPVTRTR